MPSLLGEKKRLDPRMRSDYSPLGTVQNPWILISWETFNMSDGAKHKFQFQPEKRIKIITK